MNNVIVRSLQIILFLSAVHLYAAQWTTYTSINDYYDVAFSGEYMWARTDGGLVKRNLTTGNIKVFTTADGLKDNYISSVLADQQGNIWFTTAGDYDALHKVTGSAFTTFYADTGFHAYLLVKAVGSDGSLWFSDMYPTRSIAYSFRNDQWTRYDTTSGLPAGQGVTSCFAYGNRGIAILSVYTNYQNGNIMEIGVSSSSGDGWQPVTTTRYLQLYPSWWRDMPLCRNPGGGLLIGSDGVLTSYNDTVWTTWSLNDGAPREIRALAVTPGGTVWAAGDLITWRHDGSGWKSYPHPHTAITSLVVDSSGTVWAGALLKRIVMPDGSRVRVGGLSRFNGTGWDTLGGDAIYDMTVDTKGWLCYVTGTDAVRRKGDSTHTINDLLYYRGMGTIAAGAGDHIWIGTDDAVARYNTSTGQCSLYYDGLVNPDIEVIAADGSGNIWCASKYGDISRIRSGGIDTVLFDDDFQSRLGPVYDLHCDTDGNMWVSGQAGLAVYRETGWEMTYSMNDNELLYVRNAVTDAQDTVWTATSVGLVRYDGSTWTWYTGGTGLPGKDIRYVLADRNGDLWCAVADGGICKKGDTGWVVFDTTHGLKRLDFRWLREDAAGTIWAGYYKGFARLNGSSWEQFDNQPAGTGPAGNQIYTLCTDRTGCVWAGTYELSVFNGTSWTSYPGYPYWKSNALITDRNNHIWSATDYGIGVFDGTGWTVYDTGDGLTGCNTKVLALDSAGAVWCGTRKGQTSPYESGLCRFMDGTWTRYDTLGVLPYRASSDTCVFDDIYSITVGKNGEVYVSARYRADKSYLEFEHILVMYDGSGWTVLDTSRQYYFGLTLDNDGNLWTGMYRYYDGAAWTDVPDAPSSYLSVSGVCDKTGTMWFPTTSGVWGYDGISWRRFTTADGLADNSVYAVTVDRRNRKWFGTSGGISVFEADSLFDKVTSAVELSSVSVGPNPFTADLTITYTRELEETDRLKMEVFDRSGHRVARLSSVSAGQKSVVWDGRDASGKYLAQGIYYLYITSGDKQDVVRVIRIE